MQTALGVAQVAPPSNTTFCLEAHQTASLFPIEILVYLYKDFDSAEAHIMIYPTETAVERK